MVSILRNGTLALLELDVEDEGLTGRVRRWPVHWDDLVVDTMEPCPDDPADGYRLGLSDVGREAVQHATLLGTKISLCGKSVYPLPVCGWSMRFSPTAARACPACIRLINADTQSVSQPAEGKKEDQTTLTDRR
ncbi:hypothetical protein ACGFNP_41030 [Nonomuraea sp. NPDC049269]|uniref:hypothetical protein n=1 Tax=Nonomuraea sp. NPDC049269 TaxID=3364349 RepID=UPI00371E0607